MKFARAARTGRHRRCSSRTHRSVVPTFHPIRPRVTRTALAGAILAALASPAAFSAIETCGEPQMLKGSEAAAVAWKDCTSDTWHLAVTAGGSAATIDYTGSVTSTSPASNIRRDSFESDDVLRTGDPTNLTFEMHVEGRGRDEFTFRHPATADVCLTLAQPGSRVLVGPNRTPVTSPVNLRTMGSCSTTPVAGPIDTCGQPPLLKDSEAAAIAWEDCGSGTWSFAVTGGGSNSLLSYTGSITSNASASSINRISLESDDVLNTSDLTDLRFNLKVAGPGQDQFSVSHPSSAEVCVDFDLPGNTLLVGPDRAPVSTPIDLRTMAACDGSGTGVTNPPPPPPPAPGPGPSPTDPGADYNHHAYLDDADRTDSVVNMGNSDVGEQPFPRITLGPIKTTAAPAMLAKYGGAAAKGFSFDWLARVQAENPDFIGKRIYCPQEYQGWTEQRCRQGSGIPFNGTGPNTANCDMYAGHWLYSPGSRLQASISATATTVRVADASRFDGGQYAVIYSGNPGAFNNPEHVQIQSVNRSTNTLTLSKRGFKSTARSHPSGAIIAQHVLGNGGGHPENWAYNMSTESPRDGTGRQMNQVAAAWLADNYDLDNVGRPTDASIEGILFDVDFHFVMQGGNQKRIDADNNLIEDRGVSPSGVNWWGDGLDEFYTRLRNRLPNVLIVGGVIEARGFTSLNGTQLEGWPQRGSYTSARTRYEDINGRMSAYSAHMHHGTEGPRYSEAINRQPTLLYPDGADVRPTSNAPFRFSFGLALLDDGYYGQQNWHVADPWWDEYSVDVRPGSPNYGRALRSNPTNESAIIENQGWMGMPLGPRFRVYSESQFALNRNLMPNSTFDSNLGNWDGEHVNLSRTTSVTQDGAGAMRVSSPTVPTLGADDAVVFGPSVSLQAGQEYTLVFSTRADEIRQIEVAFANMVQEIYLPAKWTRQVLTFRADRNVTVRPRLKVGREAPGFWLDSVYLFEGNADVFRRDFENAIVVVNATPSQRTVPLNGTFQRIRGTGQDPVNNGATVTQVTLPPYDAAVLVRPQ